MHNFNLRFNLRGKIISALFLMGSLTLASAQQTSKMPHIILPLVNSSVVKPLYTPGKTNITEISAQKNYAPDESLLQSETLQEEQQQEYTAINTSICSEDFQLLDRMGLLSNINKILDLQTPDITSIVAELKNARTFLPENFSRPSKQELILAKASDDVSILRFIVNGQDIQPACSNLYFSGIENNGSFILTGDFCYLEGNKNYKDTFYFLFTAQGTQEGQTLYNVTSSVDQNIKNSFSPISQLSVVEDLKAFKTGAFVSIHNSNDNIEVDFLLSVKNSALSQRKF